MSSTVAIITGVEMPAPPASRTKSPDRHQGGGAPADRVEDADDLRDVGHLDPPGHDQAGHRRRRRQPWR
jgi:hypothetical protein